MPTPCYDRLGKCRGVCPRARWCGALLGHCRDIVPFPGAARECSAALCETATALASRTVEPAAGGVPTIRESRSARSGGCSRGRGSINIRRPFYSTSLVVGDHPGVPARPLYRGALLQAEITFWPLMILTAMMPNRSKLMLVRSMPGRVGDGTFIP